MASSLYDEIDSDALVAEVVLLRAASTKSVMLVEGGDDEKVFVHFIDEDKCEIVICHGHENATRALAKLERREIPGILCIIDADFSAFVRGHVGGVNLLQTDDHDLEVMIFKSRAFEKVLGELGSQGKIKKLKDQWVDLREPIWKSAHHLGIFRLYSAQNGLNLKFEELSFRFVDRRSLSVNINLMIETVFNHSRKPIGHVDKIKVFIQHWLGESHDHWQMCCGHDIAVVLGKGLQSLLGSQPSAMTDGPAIERQLRLAYSTDQFRESALYLGIRNWEQKNVPFLCLQGF
jgi:Protein of unknown function (DUF4435)